MYTCLARARSREGASFQCSQLSYPCCWKCRCGVLTCGEQDRQEHICAAPEAGNQQLQAAAKWNLRGRDRRTRCCAEVPQNLRIASGDQSALGIWPLTPCGRRAALEHSHGSGSHLRRHKRTSASSIATGGSMHLVGQRAGPCQLNAGPCSTSGRGGAVRHVRLTAHASGQEEQADGEGPSTSSGLPFSDPGEERWPRAK